jgi:hypothetical protein
VWCDDRSKVVVGGLGVGQLAQLLLDRAQGGPGGWQAANRVRRTLRTRLPLLNARQKARLGTVLADKAQIAVERCWIFYQRLIAAYSHPDGRRGKTMISRIINSRRLEALRRNALGFRNVPTIRRTAAT